MRLSTRVKAAAVGKGCPKSGSELRTLQTLARLISRPLLREAFGVRPACRRFWFCLLATFWLGLNDATAAPFRPIPGKGAATKTLLLYSETHAAYSLLNGLELVKLQLGRVATEVEAVPLFKFQLEKLAAADYAVVLFPQAYPPLLSNVVAALASSRAPVLWIGFGAETVQEVAPFKGAFEMASRNITRSAQRITYREKTWDVDPFNYLESRLLRNSNITTIATTALTNGAAVPICWKVGNLTYFGAEPQAGMLGFVFEDVLLDFFGVKDLSPPSLVLRITGYVPQSNHRELKRMADFLHSRSVPFGISIAGLSESLMQSDAGREFVESLRYAQQRGGRIILQGTRASGAAEFWDTGTDRPVDGLKAESIRQQIIATAEVALQAGLLPVAWQTPQYVASSDAYTEMGKIFGTAFERLQLSDATAKQNYVPGGLSMDRYRRLIVPENLGFVANGSNGLQGIQARAEVLRNLRGTVLGCSIDAFQGLSRLVELVTLLESYHLSFVDLADLDNRVELPNAVLLTGKANANINVRDATLRWKTFNRAGQLLAEDEQRTKVSGQRELKRIGIGVFEVVRFSTAANGEK